MAGAASAHQAATASREQISQQRAGHTRRTSADPQQAQQGATAAAAAPTALNSLSRLQHLADASPQVAQLRRLQALADGRFARVAQLAGGTEEEELVQGKFSTAQFQPQLQQAPRVNNTGLPDQLKSGIESLSGLLMDDVRVHLNSSQPAQLNALAYAQGSDIYIAPGQERHLPHEALHVVQQAHGRVRPTLQMKQGVLVNDDVGLEREADVMGPKALEGGHRVDETHLSISISIEAAQQIEGDATNSLEVNVANNDITPLDNGRGSAQRGGNEVQRIADQRPGTLNGWLGTRSQRFFKELSLESHKLQSKYQARQGMASSALYQVERNHQATDIADPTPFAMTPFGQYRYAGGPLENRLKAQAMVDANALAQRQPMPPGQPVSPSGRDHIAMMEGGIDWHMQAISSEQSSDGLVVQCVGGPKFGMQVTGDAANDQVQVGLSKLREKQAAYKLDISTTKEAAINTFKNGGDPADAARQAIYTAALTAAEMTPEGLLATLDGGLTYVGDVIFFNDIEIAQIRRGDAAYVQHQAADAVAGTAAIYKRHTLNGPSGKEFVDVRGAKLRRFAYRGITPPERLAYRTGAPLRPVNHGVNEGHTGYNFNPATGAPVEREHNSAADPPKLTDLEWLNDKAGTSLREVPASAPLRAFLQTRKGAGKLLSATSTPRRITSNHGVEFTGFGKIRIDLARVPAANIVHHYKQDEFNSGVLNAAVGRRGVVPRNLRWETERANETVRRNRELVISEIPAAAVVSLTDSPERLAYEDEFVRLYNPQFTQGFNEAILESGLNLAEMAAPAPAAYPWNEDHFGVLQARTDFKPAIARSNGCQAAQTRIDFGTAYAAEYGRAWEAAFESAAWESDYITRLQQSLADENRYDEFGEIAINTPDAPDPGVIPVGVGNGPGAAAGHQAGVLAGELAGDAYGG
jgi:hypothetical protein